MQGIVLDTNILSEFFRPDANAKAVAWMKSQKPEDLYLTIFTIGEIRIGIERLPVGKKCAALEVWLETVVLPNFAGRILVFDLKAADLWARLAANDAKNGRPRPTVDIMIAAITLAHGLVLATRNIRDFADLDMPLTNPFA